MHSYQISYNDEFDKTHYPIQDWQREQILKLSNAMNLPINTVWFYHATGHGAIFWIAKDEKNRLEYSRLDADTVQCIANLKGLRWLDCSKSLEIGITHLEPKEVIR